MTESSDYQERPELYDQAMEALGVKEEVFEEYRSGDYSDPFEVLESEGFEVSLEGDTVLDGKKQVVEVAEVHATLNSDTGSLAGMDYLHTGSASD
ncbi:MAG: hypothetical protein ABEJ36_00325 [Candidatus Nanosalina sp.]